MPRDLHWLLVSDGRHGCFVAPGLMEQSFWLSWQLNIPKRAPAEAARPTRLAGEREAGLYSTNEIPVRLADPRRELKDGHMDKMSRSR